MKDFNYKFFFYSDSNANAWPWLSCTTTPRPVLRCVPLNPIVWCYVWLNVVINKVVLLLSKIMKTWIFGHYHIVHEMHSMLFTWFSYRRYKSQVLWKLKILVRSRWWRHFICENYNISTKIIYLDHGNGDF